MAPESTSMTDTGGPGGTTVGGNVAEAGEAVANKIETFEELMGPKGRYRLRELAQTMKESGALRIKDHRTIQGNFPNSFKGECASVIPTMAVAYARDWILGNESTVTCVTEALRVGQAMLDLSIFHCVTNSSTFDGKHLYAFRSDNLGSVANLQRRVVAIEDQHIAQTKANKEAQADAMTKSVQLDWRVSVAERRLAASESALRRTIVVQQVLIGTLLALLFVNYVPLGGLSTYLSALGLVVLVIALLESRRMLCGFVSHQIDYRHIASAIMGLHVSEELDETIARSVSMETPPSVAHSSTTLDAATKTLLYAFPLPSVIGGLVYIFSDCLSSSIDSSRAMFESVWSSVVAPTGSEPAPAPPRSILNQGDRRRQHLPRTTFALPSELEDDMDATDRSERQPSERQPSAGSRLARRSMPVVAATADAAVLEAGWKRPSLDATDSWNSQSIPTPRYTYETNPIRVPPGSSAGYSHQSPQSGGPSVPASPTVGAPPGPPSAVDFEDWWTPNMVVRQPHGEIQLTNPHSSRGRVRINNGECHEFDGPLFKGRITVWVKGLPIGAGCADVFKKKRRQTWVIVQGRFKRRVPVGEVYTGQMFSKKIEDVPQPIVKAVTFLVQSFTRVVSSASIIENSEVPVVLYPLILAAQSVHVSTPGMEPEVAAGVDHEDASLLMSQGDWDPASGLPSDTERKAFFSKTANRKDICYDPGHVYTFHIMQHIVDVANYRIPVPGFGKFNLLPYLQGQPIRFMAYDRNSQMHLWNLEAWHRGLIDKAAAFGRAVDGSSGAGDSSWSPDSAQDSNTLALLPDEANRSPSPSPRRGSGPFASQRGHTGKAGKASEFSRQLHHSGAFGHDGSFGHDGPVVQRAPSGNAKYSNVSIEVPDGPVMGREGSVATPKMFTHRETPPENSTVYPQASLRRTGTFDKMFNTAPSTFKPGLSAPGSQMESDRASVHSGQAAISEDSHPEWASDRGSDTSKVLDGFEYSATRAFNGTESANSHWQNWDTTPRSIVSADSVPTSSRTTHIFETQMSVCHRRVASDASVTFRGFAPGNGNSPPSESSSIVASAPGDNGRKKKSKFRLKRLFRRATKH